MARIGITIGGMALLSLLFSCKELPNADARALARPPRFVQGDPVIRVAVRRGRRSVTLEVEGPYRIFDLTGRPVASGARMPLTRVRASGGRVSIGAGGAKFPRLMLAPERPGSAKLDGAGHQGELVFIADGEKLHVVSTLPLELYLCGVLLGEVPVSQWRDEALKAQAVASRTYALFQIARRARHDWDVTNTQSSQVYKAGHGSNPTVNRVVNATRGQVLLLDGMVIPAYFHSSCGGHTEANGKVFNEMTIGPLSGSPCGYCAVQSNKFAHWTKSFRKSGLAASIRRRVPVKAVPRIQNVRAIEVTRAGVSGRAVRVRIRHAFAPFEISADALRHALGAMKLPSTLFTIKQTRSAITFTGAGWGHGVGMCQYGAEGMARAGFSYRAILGRYYRGAALTGRLPG